jgi:hypothetical protein
MWSTGARPKTTKLFITMDLDMASLVSKDSHTTGATTEQDADDLECMELEEMLRKNSLESLSPPQSLAPSTGAQK